jgi:hypothetical protein
MKLGKYKHFKGKEYEVLGIAKDSDTLEKMVVYKALYGKGQLWIRPFKEFFGKIEINGKKMKRFEYIG